MTIKVAENSQKFTLKILKIWPKMLEIWWSLHTLLIVSDMSKIQKNTNFYRKMHVKQKKYSLTHY